METAPLTLAHTHARNAVLETRKSNPVAASEEHDLAAGEFAAAAQKSSDREALRTLQLLEQHHKKLAQILRFQHENPPAAASGTQQVTVESGGGKTDTQQYPPKLLGHARLPARETSSIASNLASARGIPSQPRRGSPVSPTVSSQQAGAKMTEGPAKIRTSEARLRERQAYATKERPNRTPSKQSWNPPAASPTDITSQQFVPPDAESSHLKDRQATSEEPFQRFYSTFEGLISKLSAPLAFAGLPLGSDVSEKAESARKTSADTKVDRQPAVSDRQSQSGDTDISRIFSRAALRAVRDSTGGGTGSTAESFYVVPTTGGTVSYAGILSRAEKEARRSSFEEGDEDFVDARETPPSPEMRQSMTGSKGRGSRGKDKLTSIQSPKTLEELQMENQALKHLTDTLSKRLHMWEVNAQSSSMALQQSLRAMHHQNVPSPEHFPQSTPAVTSPIAPLPTPASADQEQRIRELEELIQQSEKELDKVGRENDKLRNVVGRYRDRWEKLKEGAKTRREGRSTADRNSYAEPSTPVRTGSTSTQKASETTHVQAEGAAENDTNSSNEPEGKNDSSS